MSKKFDDVQNLLLGFEEKIDAQELDISRLELANSKLLEQLKSKEKELEISNKLFKDLVTIREIAGEMVSSSK